LFPNVSDAPVRLPGKALDHVFESPSEILQSIGKFYVNETLKQIYKIIGSLDFVGNPTMLVTSFVSGVRDLVVAPSVAFMKSPTDPSRVGIGVAQGTLSLVSHSTSGFFGVLAKVSATAGQSVATLSLDTDFRDWHRDKVVVEATNLNREWKRRGVQSVGQMLARPVVDILLGVTGGISGIVISPVKGYQRNGRLGLVKGIAVGGIGLIAKPTVGVLDAFTHFTASIHDIAKSVNVLDRRLQPALKLRLPYTFGIMSILAPFDPAAARAARLLKLFPIKESRRTSDTVPSESMIHVEILPSTGTETYAIATSSRVVLVRVKKESSGSLTTSLCWEVAFSEDSAISSRVDDHGHNGVALTLLKRVHDTSGKSESKEAGSVSESSPLFIGRSFASLRTIGLTTPEERISSATTAEEYDHGTGRGAEGDLLEWFTILAEYQYRRQLTRLHNAISCITGAFDAIVRDPSLGRPSSTEGYTSFGMFFFESNSLPEQEGKATGLVNLLDSLPWVSKSMLEEAREMTPSAQKQYLSNIRSEWDFAHDLEASKREGGPEWLILARARAAFVDNDNALSSSPMQRDEGSLPPLYISKLARTASWTGGQPLPTIQDEETDSDDQETSVPPEALSKYMSARLFEPDDSHSQLSWVEDSDRHDGLDFHAGVSTGIDENSVQLDMYGYQSPNKMTLPRFAALGKGTPISESSDLSIQSYRTAATSRYGRGPHGGNGLMSHSTSSLDDGLLGSTTSRFKSAVSRATSAERQKAAAEDDSHTQPRRPEEGRMDRMEALLERLLIFSSEQALRQTPTVDHDEAASLRQEISELRNMIQQTQPSVPSSQEVAALREDVAALRAQLGLSSATPADEAASSQQEDSTLNLDECFIEQVD
jgi:Vacuolar-sorting-associated 13 protein C-terminal